MSSRNSSVIQKVLWKFDLLQSKLINTDYHINTVLCVWRSTLHHQQEKTTATHATCVLDSVVMLMRIHAPHIKMTTHEKSSCYTCTLLHNDLLHFRNPKRRPDTRLQVCQQGRHNWSVLYAARRRLASNSFAIAASLLCKGGANRTALHLTLRVAAITAFSACFFS
jgi:hypothetical protein